MRTGRMQLVILDTTPWSAPVTVDWVLTPPWGVMRAIRTRAGIAGRSRRYQEAKTSSAEISHDKIGEEGYPGKAARH